MEYKGHQPIKPVTIGIIPIRAIGVCGPQKYKVKTPTPTKTRTILSIFPSSLSYRFEQFVRKIDEVITSNLKDQVFTFLCERQNSFGEIIITHQELAKEFGTEREVISRILATLKKSGKVLLSKGKINIV